MKLVLRNPKLYSEPEGTAPPPKGIRALLIFTCTAVSFAHGGNDGQKGMGLIMLLCGLLGLMVPVIAYFIPAIRNAERILPDHDQPAPAAA